MLLEAACPAKNFKMKDEILAFKERTQQVLDSDYVTPSTKKVLEERMEKKGVPVFFNADSFALLSRVCDLLMDQDSNNRMVEIALFVDERLQNRETDGWRYDCMPTDDEMYTLGLKAINATAIKNFQDEFIRLTKEQQLEILSLIQQGDIEKEIWKELDARLFFEELLAETTAIFFSHPLVQTSINYVGMADAKGWTKLKLDQKEKLEEGR